MSSRRGAVKCSHVERSGESRVAFVRSGFCLAGWAWSGTHGTSVRATGRETRFSLTSEWGVISASCGQANSPRNEFDYLMVRMVEDHWWPIFTGYSHAGFACYRQGGGFWSWNASVPYWFLTLVVIIVVVFVWFRTGRRRRAGRGFPVETKGGRESGG